MSKLQNLEINNAWTTEYSAELNTPSNRLGTVNDKGEGRGDTWDTQYKIAHPGWMKYSYTVVAR
jgi:hypothetical protein